MKQNGPAPESSLLLTLEEISHLVAHSHDPGETLSNIVALIRNRFETDVCSVYSVDPETGELILGATLGLRPEAVGQVRMKPGEGLTGLAVETRAPVMVEDAQSHPRFKYFPEVGEDLYHSFLGVPLVEGGVVQGVLVVQTREPRPFLPDEVRLLVAVGTQIAPLVSGASLLRRIVAAEAAPSSSPEPEPELEPILGGLGLGGGIGVGRVYVMAELDMIEPSADPGIIDPDAERARLETAIEATGEEIQRSSRRISALVGEDHAAILQAQLLILQDRTIRRDLDAGVAAGRSAESVLLSALKKYVEMFQALNNPFFRERVFDLKDVFRRLYWHLRPEVQNSEEDGERVVLVSREASVLDLVSVDLDRLAGVIVQNGGPHCHAAILARSLGVPMVGQVAGATERLAAGGIVRIDGATGRVEVLREMPEEPAGEEDHDAQSISETVPMAVAIPAAGMPRIEATINLLGEVDRVLDLNVSGVGLYRTEFLLLARRTLPTEEEQVELYRKLLTRLGGRPASIRTFDLRPDKMAHLAHVSPDNARAFDWRRVLTSPVVQELFRDQVRAILRAATAGEARILVPLVTHSAQLRFVVETVGRCREDLEREGLEHGRNVPLGIMIETAAALPMIEEWAPVVDFFGLGTSDLTASALGLDRDDPVGIEGTVNHPGLLRMLREAVEASHRAGRPITACGELATTPESAASLASFGIDALSIAIDRLAETRRLLLREAAVA